MNQKANTKTTKNKKETVTNSKKIPYQRITATCACGAEYETGSTAESIRVDICANCHPFFTGEKRILDSEGRVEKFLKKYQNHSK